MNSTTNLNMKRMKRVKRVKPVIHNKTGSVCPCCYDEIKGEGILLHKTRRQTHRLCLECGSDYLNGIINNANSSLRRNNRVDVTKFSCPGTPHGALRNQCNKQIDLRNINIQDSTSKLYTDIFRVVYASENLSVFLCPNEDCGELIEVNPRDRNMRTVCVSCQYVWCRGCQLRPYHEDMSCLEYEIKEGKTETGRMLKEKQDAGIVKKCPNCNVIIEKNGGCNKIICSTCRMKWCWVCNATNIDYSHFYADNKDSPCAGNLGLREDDRDDRAW